MVDSETDAEYKQGFTARVAAARVALGWKQWQMAQALGMQQDKYKQYETRSLLPTRLIPTFCLIARVDLEWMLTGRGKMGLKPLPDFTPDIYPAKRQPRKGRSRKVA